MWSSKGKHDGVSIYMVVVLLFVLFGLAVGLSSLVLGQLTILKSMGNSITAFYAADSGTEKMLYEIKQANPEMNEFTSSFYEESVTASDFSGSSFSVGLLCHYGGMGENQTLCQERCDGCPTDQGEPEENKCIPRFCITSKGTFQGTNRAIEVKY